MSGYNKTTDTFELTSKKAAYWFRRENVPSDCQSFKDQNNMEFYACVLRSFDLEVLHVDHAFLKVRATPGQIWEASSGQPSDPERAAYNTK